MESLCLLNWKVSLLGRANWMRRSLVALRHCMVELKKHVFPRFLSPRPQNMNSWSLISETSADWLATEMVLF
jgi:hypothetical protein